jgi:glycine hydroxymethyltransferase
MSDFLFRGSIADLDPNVDELIDLEAERQYKKLILIPSESSSPAAVREALSSTFHNIYAEGYPDESSRKFTEDEIFQYGDRLSHYRRYSDPRYYKGVEYADIVEALARRRAAEAYAANGVTPDEIYVNVQALSGGPANNAVYNALVNPGDTVMGMDLRHGGHLSHGSPVNRSGKYYNIVSFEVDPDTEMINYDTVAELALENKPKMIFAGFSSYPWQVDWLKFREIADSIGAYLIADISHISGLIVGKVHPSPIGIADVVTTTTHKTLCGPRGALIMTTSKSLSNKLDRAVFPGEQGGPHVNVFAALAIALKIARSDQFHELQKQIVKNTASLTKRLEERGFKIPFGGTDTHLMNLDVRSVKGPDGTSLSGDIAARLLDLAGIVTNRNTIPGDRSPLNPNGIRMGTPWITQRGFKEKDTIILADLIADTLQAAIPYKQKSISGYNRRAKIDFVAFEKVRIAVRDLAVNAGIDYEISEHDYPHFNYLDDKFAEDSAAFFIHGRKINWFMNYTFSSDVESLKEGDSQPTSFVASGKEIKGTLTKTSAKKYKLSVASENAGLAAAWLRDLSDGFIRFDEDLLRKLPGPIAIEPCSDPDKIDPNANIEITKPYFISGGDSVGTPLPEFKWEEKESEEVLQTPLNQTHRDLGAKMVPFAGWEMPVWYTSVVEEHLAVRQAAGLFDVSHMGVYQAEGPHAGQFLDSVCGNDISALDVGESLYTHFLDPDANVIDDLLVYRRAEEKYLVVVNASNDDKDWAWLNAVKESKVLIDRKRPSAKTFGRDVILRNLRHESAGEDMRVDLALQGPRSRDILLALGCDAETEERIMKLKRTRLCEAQIGGFDLVVSRTGYTGEKMAFELFVHTDKLVDLWNALLKVGEQHGLKPIGLGARDSLRTEAGLPLYGHEMGGDQNFGVGYAGFRKYVKTYKPWFIGRDAFLAQEASRKQKLIRFRFPEKGTRMAHNGDPVVDKRGKVIGQVTSCAVDADGLLTGQAIINIKDAKKGSLIFIFQSASEKPAIAPALLEHGDKIYIPTMAIILSRFP